MQFLKVFSLVAFALGVCVTAITLPQGMPSKHNLGVPGDGFHPMTVADDGSPTPSNNIARAVTPSYDTAHEVSSSSFIATMGRNKVRIVPTPVPNILSTPAHSTHHPPAKTMDKAYGTSCFAVTLPTSTASSASRSPIDVRYTRREALPNSANVVEREPQTASILVWCFGGTEEGKILSESLNTGTELAKPA
ncbi:hypothetical protein KC363_g1424 [Hortaea werneckii]|nr:hypothetical protein KC361_g4309 [Hortaea werneckii]KAI6889007.1 hypothetical protein KC325_g862 [Hortaea werneckii]KAI7000735.1 hypothetical protein KC359_g1027 [Hortaea werneckii]KAI7148612.1 hypothetical protein KC344_g1813 [Hortaea werneckii]KAI7179786.1 hypothetical protein KC360_g506 [Hortaea werneckii]